MTLSVFSKNTSNQSSHFMIVSVVFKFNLLKTSHLYSDLMFQFADVFDVVRDMKDRVFLLDFSPFNEKYTESLAFEWSELLDDCEVLHVFYLLLPTNMLNNKCLYF